MVSGKDNSQREGQWSAGLSSAGAATSSIFVATKFCRDEHVLVIVFVATKSLLVTTNIVVVSTKVCLSR